MRCDKNSTTFMSSIPTQSTFSFFCIFKQCLTSILSFREGSHDDEHDEPAAPQRKKQKKAKKQKPTPAAAKRVDLARGDGNQIASSSSDDDDDDADGGGRKEAVQDRFNIHEKWGALDHNVPHVEWTSRRLAVCNLDWDKMTAEDVLVSLNSFKPAEGEILSIHVYLSDFGHEQLQYEEEHGPRLKSKDDASTAPTATAADGDDDDDGDGNDDDGDDDDAGSDNAQKEE